MPWPKVTILLFTPVIITSLKQPSLRNDNIKLSFENCKTGQWWFNKEQLVKLILPTHYFKRAIQSGLIFAYFRLSYSMNFKHFPMARLEPRISDVGSDCSANSATATVQGKLSCFKQLKQLKQSCEKCTSFRSSQGGENPSNKNHPLKPAKLHNVEECCCCCWCWSCCCCCCCYCCCCCCYCCCCWCCLNRA